ncbi:MAG: hypothetical protein QW350_05140 [Candidatus Aenigmatarchaeota archaeon]|jgi:hypothetical protein
MYNYLIITVPHSFCYRKTPRVCDRNASNASQTLFEISPFNTVKFLNNSVRRKDLDLNRNVSLKSKFRQQLRSKIIELKQQGYRPILIDIHSFFPESKDYKEYDVLILDVSHYKNNELTQRTFEIEKKIVEKIRETKKYKTGILKGSKLNSIIMDGLYTFNIPSILIEYNEKLSISELKEINTKVIEGISIFFQ